MRVLVLVLAVVLCAGSANTARSRHELAKYSCSSQPAALQANCYANANTEYVVESQREMVDQQQQQQTFAAAHAQNQAAYDQSVRRCEVIAGAMLRCEMVTPSDAVAARNHCMWSLTPNASARAYGQVLCYEQADTCERMSWCLTH